MSAKRFLRRHRALFVALGLIMVIGIIAYLSHNRAVVARVQTAQPGLWYVTHDTDGDTIDVQQGSTTDIVRLIGADTPETHDPRKPVQCYGPVAAAYTKAQVEHKYVRLVADPVSSNRDKYGRLLRYVYLPDGTDLNAQLISQGYAFAYVVFPFGQIDQFRALQAQAKAANVGLWKACNVDSSDIILQTAGAK